MSCSADYYLVFWSGSADSYVLKQFIMCYNIMQHRLVGATNNGSADYSALTMCYSRNSMC